MEQILNIYDLNWFIYFLGYLFLPRITLLFILYFHGDNLWSYRWAIYSLGWIFMPRMFIGLLIAFTTQNYVAGVVLTLLGYFIDGGSKYGFFRWRSRRKN